MSTREKTGWYHKYRPTTWNEIVGQTTAVDTLTRKLKKGELPNAILLDGPSGCGKTTLARILRDKLGVISSDYVEINAAGKNRGIETIKGIQETVNRVPMKGGHRGHRMWVFDEAHSLTKDAQQALLKILEDSPAFAHFVICTTEGNKLLKTIQNRCTVIKIGSIPDNELTELITRVAKQERVKLTADVKGKIVAVAEGSARKALVILEQIADIKGEEDRLDAIQRADTQKFGIDLARLLIKPQASWKEISKLLKELDDEPETIRRIVLGYCASVTLGGGPLSARCDLIYDHFRDPFFDVGKPGLVFACYRVAYAKR
jgi:DNA polymerase III gamma/tau subunit